MSKIPTLLRALADEVESIENPTPAPAPTPVPEPAPAPSPAPEPPPPPPVGNFTIHTQPINRARVVWPIAWAWSDSYDRSTELLLWQPGASVRLDYQRGPMISGVPSILPVKTYTLLIDGSPVATTQLAEGQKWFAFTFDAPTVPGWRTLTVDGLDDGESQITYFAAVAGSVPTSVPVVASSHEMSFRYRAGDWDHAWAWVPVGPAVAHPTPDYLYSSVSVESEQTADMLLPGDKHPPVSLHQAPDGTWVTMGKQAYFWDQVILLNRPVPDVHLLDGPRGIGTMCFTTHIEVGRATQTEDPASLPRRNIYACDPWRFVRVSNTGEVTTLAGWRHRTGIAEGAPELVGDWSAVPEERRGFRLLWGMCWDSRTLAVDPLQPPIDGRPPHVVGPRAYVADSMRNRICRLQFPAAEHAPATVSEVFNGEGVWDCVEYDGAMIVSLRSQNRVVRMSFDGEILETLIEHDSSLTGAATVDYRHVAWRDAGTIVEQAQAHPVLCPEGLFVLDGLLYIGSKAQECITVFDLAQRRIVRRIPVYIGGNSNFVKLAVSDGSYAPRGTVFYCTFEVQDGARWFGIKPDGTRWVTATNAVFPMETYQMSVGIGGGRLIAGGSDYGLVRHSKGPRLDEALYNAGELEFMKSHGRLVYGPQGVGRFTVPAQSPALKYFLDANYAQ